MAALYDTVYELGFFKNLILFRKADYMKIFLHGLESSSRGAKASFLHELYPDMIIPDFSGSLAERMHILKKLLAGHAGIKIVGSSFGGLMATIYAMENKGAVDRIILLAPALNFPEFSGYTIRRLDITAWMVIGSKDTVTPPAEVIPVAGKIFSSLHYEEVEDDHLLAQTFRNLDWQTMLQK